MRNRLREWSMPEYLLFAAGLIGAVLFGVWIQTLVPRLFPRPSPKLAGAWAGTNWDKVLKDAKRADVQGQALLELPLPRIDSSHGVSGEAVLGYVFGKAGDKLGFNFANGGVTLNVLRDGKDYQELPPNYPDPTTGKTAKMLAWELWDYDTGQLIDWAPNELTLDFQVPARPVSPDLKPGTNT